VDLKKLSTSERVIGASGIVLLLASFLSWFSLEDFTSFNAWEIGFLWGRLPVLLGVVMVAHLAISNFAPDLQVPDLPWPKVHLVAGIAVAVIVVLKLIIGEEVNTIIGEIEFDRGIGLFLAALAAIGLGVGGFLYNKEHGEAPETGL
jgi:hypothetical protein